MSTVTRLITQFIFVLALVAGQFVYAEHSVEVSHDQHNHGVSCTLCLSQANETATVTLWPVGLIAKGKAAPAGYPQVEEHPANHKVA